MVNILQPKVLFLTAAVCGVLQLTFFISYVSAEGHFLPGVVPIRDFAALPQGWIYQQYNVFYSSDRFKNRNGNTVDSMSAGGVTAELDLDVDIFAISPTFIYMSDIELLGSNLGFSLAPSFGNTSVNAAISAGEFGREIDDSNFGIGDLFIQPLWMVWQRDLMDLTFAYAFYAPIGEFDIDDNDNIGLGYWSNQFQATGLFYLDETKATAFSIIGTFEINGEQEDSDYQPGNNIAVEWGISQFLSEQVEVGLSGYHYWQVSDDKGLSGPVTPGRERVHGIGAQASYYLSESFGFMLRFLTEVEARSRFEGNLFSLTVFYVL